WLASREPAIQGVLISLAWHRSLMTFEPLGRYERLLLGRPNELPVPHLVLSGRRDEVTADLPPLGLGWLALADGHWDDSARHFEAALKAGRKTWGSRWCLQSISSLAYLLACIGAGRRA